MTTLPIEMSTTSEISLISGITQNFNASGTLESYEIHYYQFPFLVWFVIAIPTLFIFSRIIKEYVKRF